MLKSRYFMKIDWDIFREKRCLCCLQPFTPKVTRKEYRQSTENYIDYYLCPQCASEVQKQKAGFCSYCGEILPDKTTILTRCGHCYNEKTLWNSFFFFTKYETTFRELILKAKFNHNRACTKFLGELLAIDFLEQNQAPRHLDIIPMPLHEKRLIERGSNQCIEILDYFMDYLQNNSQYTATLHKHVLRKSKHTVAQSSLDKKDRQANIRNSFMVSENFLAKNHLKEIILFDDIATTNSTLKESCRELIKAGFENIHIMVLAKA